MAEKRMTETRLPETGVAETSAKTRVAETGVAATRTAEMRVVETLRRLLVPGLAVALLAATLIAISIGSVTVPVPSVWRIIGANLAGRAGSVDPLRQQVIWDIRTPRVLLAAVAGAGLSVAGVAFQALVRNPLADPYVLGVSSGSSLGAVLVTPYGTTALGGLGVAGGAFGTALGTVLLVYLLAQRGGRLLDSRLLLAGVAVGYLCSAATSYLQLQVNPSELQGLMFWLMGSVSGATWSDLGLPTGVIVVSGFWMVCQARNLNALTAGDDTAAGLGVPVQRLRLALLGVGSLLTATVVSVAGGIGFVGLMVPHMARFLVGADHRRVLPVSALLGAVFLVLVDLACRTVDRPNEMPIGIFTTAVGVPFFLWLLRARSRGRS